MKPKASIIIVNWNGRPFLGPCLDSLRAQTFRDFEIVLVDNGSRDGSADFVRSSYPEIRLIASSANLGFAGGNNTGLAQAQGDYIVALNSDTRADRGWLAELVRVADRQPRAGMVGCLTCSFEDSDVVDTLGGRICPDGMARGAYRGQRLSSLRLARIEEALYPSACAALYKRSMIEDIGFFDDDFFAYCEDTDLGLRARLAGWEAVLATRAVVFHRYSATSGAFSPFKVHLVERNHYWVVTKNFPLRMLLAVPFFTMVRYLQQAKSVLNSRGTGREFLTSGSRRAVIGAIARGMGEALVGLPRMLRKRRQIMGNRKISSPEMVRLLRSYRLSFRELLDSPD